MDRLSLKYRIDNKYSIEKYIIATDCSNIYLSKYKNRNYIIKECFPSQFVIRNVDNEVFTEKYIEQFKIIKESFLNEGNILKSLNIKDVVKIENIIEENGTIYLILEYYNTNTLKEYILKEYLTEKEIIKIYLKILRVINEIHKKGIIHRDIKPSNIMIDKNKEIKIIDFESAINIKDENKEYVKLTDGYSALEMYSTKSKNDIRTDTYSLSVLLYFMLNKQKPMNSIHRFYYPELIHEDVVSRRLKEFIKKGMEIEMDKRYQNVEEMILNLQS